jgi:Dephospho-CoA kinase (EC 2.7.1.24)
LYFKTKIIFLKQKLFLKTKCCFRFHFVIFFYFLLKLPETWKAIKIKIKNFLDFMDKTRLIIYLTGGIATGKSTVAKMFSELGAYVMDADKIAHKVMMKGTQAYNKIVEIFGKIY